MLVEGCITHDNCISSLLLVERVAELEAAGEGFASQLSQQESEAKAVIASWQQSCAGLELQIKELTSKLEASAKIQAELQQGLEEAQQALENAEARLRDDEDVVEKWQGKIGKGLLVISVCWASPITLYPSTLYRPCL